MIDKRKTYQPPLARNLSNSGVNGQEPEGACISGAVITWQECVAGPNVGAGTCQLGTNPETGRCQTGGNVSFRGCISGGNDTSG